MSEKASKHFPYKLLGFKLKDLREKKQESIADVSGAVEIDSEVLINIEKGTKLPGEDILLLLISHFDLKNDDAMNLWRLAGYDNIVDSPFIDPIINENLAQQSAVFLLPIDARVVYTDLVQANTNNFGVVLSFQQSSGQGNNQPLTVSKVGMSREHAENLVSILQEMLKEKSNKQNINKSSSKNKRENNKWSGSQD